MTTRADSGARALANAGPRGRERSDAERRAMFARMRRRSGGVGRTWTTRSDWDALRKKQAEAKTFAERWKAAGELFDAIGRENPRHDEMLRALAGSGGGAARGALASGLAGLARHPAVRSALASIASAAGAHGLSEYRRSHPTMDPRKERAVAKAETLLEIVAALTGLKAGKKAIAAATPARTAATLRSALAGLGGLLSRAGKAVASRTPAMIRTPAGMLKRAYDAVSDITGHELPSLAAVWKSPSQLLRAKTLRQWASEARAQADDIGRARIALEHGMKQEATRILDASHQLYRVRSPAARRFYEIGRDRWYDVKELGRLSRAAGLSLRRQADKFDARAKAAVKRAIQGYVGAGAAVGTVAGVEGYEQRKIAQYERAIRDQWKKGEDYDLAADTFPMPPLLQFAVGTLGNPVEKSAVRLPAAGRFTKDLADVAAYQVSYDRIGEQERRGMLSAGAAEAARAKLATKKPWNMAGSALYTGQPAAAGVIRFYADQIGNFAKTPRIYGQIATDPAMQGVRERDADTIHLKDGTVIRYNGGDSTEIAHEGGTGGDQPLSRAATARAKELAPDGSTVRVVAGGPEGFDPDIHGRTLGYVERIPSLVAKVPGLRAVWPGRDSMKTLLAEGLAQPRYEFMGDQHSRQADYHAAAREAFEAERGLYAPEAQAALEKGGLYRWKPGPSDKPADPLQRAATIAGIGLIVSGRSGALRSLGEGPGRAVAQSWNALMAALGVAQNVRQGPKNKGGKMKAPKAYPTDYEMKVRGTYAPR